MDAEEHELLGDILMAINIEQTSAIKIGKEIT